MPAPNQLVVEKSDNPFTDPGIPYFLLNEEDATKRRLPLYLWDSKKFEGIDLLDPTPYTHADYDKFWLFGDAMNTANKTIHDTNMRVPGKVEKSQIYVITSIEGFITPTQRLNIWQHEFFYWCMAQGMIEFLLDNQTILEFPLSRAIIGNFPNISAFSKKEADTIGSSPDAVEWNLRYSVEAPRFGFAFPDAPIVARSSVTIRAQYRSNRECLDHYQDFLDRFYATNPNPPSPTLYSHDFFRIGLILRGRKYQNLERP